MQSAKPTPFHFSTGLLERNESRRVSSTDTGSTVLDGLAVELVSHLDIPGSIENDGVQRTMR